MSMGASWQTFGADGHFSLSGTKLSNQSMRFGQEEEVEGR